MLTAMKLLLLSLLVSIQPPLCARAGAQVSPAGRAGCAVIEKGRPGQFISYEGLSDTAPEVMLRLHNNTSCSIIVETDDRSPTRIRKLPNGGGRVEFVTSSEDGLKIPLHYLVQDRQRQRVPESAYGWGDSVFTYEVLAGHSAVFAVPLTNFKKRLDVVVPFNYSWEGNQGVGMGTGGVSHRVSFLAEDIPEAVLRRRR